MAVAPKKLEVGDLVEVDGRCYEIVPDRQRVLTLEPANTVTADKLDRRNGTLLATQEEIDSQLDLLPVDVEG